MGCNILRFTVCCVSKLFHIENCLSYIVVVLFWFWSGTVDRSGLGDILSVNEKLPVNQVKCHMTIFD